VNRTWLGIGIVVILAAALILVLTAGGDDPPPTTLAATTAAPTMTTPTTTTTTTTAPTTTTTTAAPPTTRDLAAREAEVEALVANLEFAMILSLYDQDSAALADVIASPVLWEALLGALASPSEVFSKPPIRDEYRLDLASVLVDDPDCIVAEVEEDPTAFLGEDGEIEQLLIVLWPADDSTFGWRIFQRWAAGTPESEWRRNCEIEDRTWRP